MGFVLLGETDAFLYKSSCGFNLKAKAHTKITPIPLSSQPGQFLL